MRTPTNITARFEGGAQSITIERGDVAACALTWRPERPGGLRGAVAFRLDGKKGPERDGARKMCQGAAAAAQKGDAPAGGPGTTGASSGGSMIARAGRGRGAPRTPSARRRSPTTLL